MKCNTISHELKDIIFQYIKLQAHAHVHAHSPITYKLHLATLM